MFTLYTDFLHYFLSIEQFFIKPRFHLLFPLTLFYMAGIWLGYGKFNLLYITISAAFLLICTLFNYHDVKKMVIFLCLMLTAITIGAWSLTSTLTEHNAFYTNTRGKKIVVKSRIANIQVLEDKQFSYATSMYITDGHDAETGNIISTIIGKKIVIYTKKNPELSIDDLCKLQLAFKKPKNEQFSLYLAKEQIAATSCMQELSYQLLSRPAYSLNRMLFSLKKNLADTLASKMSPRTYTFFSSLFLGTKEYTTGKNREMKEEFLAWGVSHYLARSGIHMTIFVFMWQLVLGLLPLGFVLKELILLILCLLYYVYSWSTISFYRALYTLILCKIITSLGRTLSMLHVLTVITLYVLITNPLHLFFLDFQLSFGITCALAFFNDVILQKKQLAHLNS